MTVLTALEIVGNYPHNTLVDAQKDPNSENWTSLLYMTRNGYIHKLMLSFDGYPYQSKEEAVNKMNNLIEIVIDEMNSKIIPNN